MDTITVTRYGGILGLHDTLTIPISTLSPAIAKLWRQFLKTSNHQQIKKIDDTGRGFDLIRYTIINNTSKHSFRTDSTASDARDERRARYNTATDFIDALFRFRDEEIKRNEIDRSRTRSHHRQEIETKDAAETKTKTKTKTRENSSIQKIKVGSTFEVRRYDSVSTGYGWEIAMSPNLILEKTEIESTDASRQHIPGSGIYRIWTFKATQPGHGLVYLLKKRSWMPDTDHDVQERVRVSII